MIELDLESHVPPPRELVSVDAAQNQKGSAQFVGRGERANSPRRPPRPKPNVRPISASATCEPC